MEKKLSPIAQSIARKRERIKALKRNPSEGDTYKIGELESQIEADQKLLEVEMDELITAYNTGRSDSRSDNSEENDRTAIQYFESRFGS